MPSQRTLRINLYQPQPVGLKLNMRQCQCNVAQCGRRFKADLPAEQLISTLFPFLNPFSSLAPARNEVVRLTRSVVVAIIVQLLKVEDQIEWNHKMCILNLMVLARILNGTSKLKCLLIGARVLVM